MTRRDGDPRLHNSWERLLANPERVLVALFATCLFSVLAAAALNTVSHAPAWNYFDVLKVFAILLGVCGAVYQFVLRRAFESALLIELTTEIIAYDASRFATHLQVCFKNIGNRRITALKALSPSAVTQYENSIAYPADLSIRRLRGMPPPASADIRLSPTPEGFVTWWTNSAATESRVKLSSESPRLEKICDPVSILEEYSTADGEIDFFMEPGEEYCFSNFVILPPGHYFIKVVFVGARANAAEYWSRIAYFNIPRSNLPGITG